MSRYIGYMPNPQPVGNQIKAEHSKLPLLLLGKDQEVREKTRALPLPEGEELNRLFKEIEARLEEAR